MAFRMSPIPQYIVDDLDHLLSTKITVERETMIPYRHPLSVSVRLEPVSTDDGVLYESHLEIFGTIGDPLFSEIWDSLSKRITLPDQALGEWDTCEKIGTSYFKVKINTHPEEAHDAVVRFFGRSGLAGVSFYERPMDYSPLKVRSDGLPVRFAWEVEATAP